MRALPKGSSHDAKSVLYTKTTVVTFSRVGSIGTLILESEP